MQPGTICLKANDRHRISDRETFVWFFNVREIWGLFVFFSITFLKWHKPSLKASSSFVQIVTSLQAGPPSTSCSPPVHQSDCRKGTFKNENLVMPSLRHDPFLTSKTFHVLLGESPNHEDNLHSSAGLLLPLLVLDISLSQSPYSRHWHSDSGNVRPASSSLSYCLSFPQAVFPSHPRLLNPNPSFGAWVSCHFFLRGTPWSSQIN